MSRRAPSRSRRTPSPLGTVEQLPSGRWRASYRRDGRKFTAPRTFDTKADGAAWLAAEHADRLRGTWHDPEAGRVRLADYAHEWLSTRADLQPRTRDLYARTIARWLVPRVGGNGSRGVELGRMDVGDITPATVRAWYAAVLSTARESVAERASRDRSRTGHPAREWARSRGMDVPSTGRLSPALVEAWQAAGAPFPRRTASVPEGAGATTAANAYRVLRTILNTAVTDGLLRANPCQIRGAGQAHSRERGTASPAEVAALASHMPPRLAAAVTLAAWSGLRYGELFALARRHVDIEAGTVRVERALEIVPGQPVRFGPPKTRKSRRTVHLPPSVVAQVAAHLDAYVGRSPDALVFTLEGGGLVTSTRLSAMFGKARARIGRPDLTWHDLRHTGATLAYAAGASVPEVQRRLGHTTMRAATIYAHAADESDRLLAAKLDALALTPAAIGA